ncbi:opioid growth factor receptor-like isoform X3 [Pyxicephalus adspersus]|uniref:opioid growth factor receptor-like isoform X3 n=1 Tax=Pyxicephalus adspersus TaxID=30357 RepID=UPI003B5C9DF9
MGSSESSLSYDSTWEEDEDDSSSNTERSTMDSKEEIYPKAQAKNLEERKKLQFRYKYMFSEAAQDMQNYRHRYQTSSSNYQNSPEEMLNLKFYRNQIKFMPNGLYIDDLLRNWKDHYDILEENHNYIQWLFPLRELGKNSYASPLHEDEIEMMKKDADVKKRLCEAYKLMLNFYGIQLLDEISGKVGQAENWQERYKNLDSHTHNNLRITRILKCLGEMGYEKFQAPLVRFFLEEILCNGNLPRVKTSALDYFMFTVKNKKERQKLVHFAYMNYKPQHEFVWGPVEKLQIYQPHSGEKSFNNDSFSYYSAENNEISENEPNKRNETLSIVRRTMRFISMPFLYFF